MSDEALDEARARAATTRDYRDDPNLSIAELNYF
jgi:hypothetical protein